MTRTRRATLSKRALYGSFLALLLAYGIAFPFAASAFIRLSSAGRGFYWSSGSQPVSFVIAQAGSDDIPDASEEAAIRLSFRTWQQVSQSSIAFEEVGGSARSRTDWQSDSVHLVYFDETASVSYFQNNAGLIAVTPVDFAGDGRITDADILFNGQAHRFSTNRASGTFDVQQIATHEVGHFIGLDHSGNFASTMYPFAEIREIRQRSLEPDDVAGAATIYPQSGIYLGAISGHVRRSNGTAVREAHIVAVDASGIPASATLSGTDGTYSVSGLADGSYRVYAEPLDGPVTAQNLFERQPATDFGTTYLGGNSFPATVTISGGSTSLVEDLVVRSTAGKNVTGINPTEVLQGAQGFVIYLYGSGFASTDTIRVSGSDVEVQSATVSGGSLATVTLRVNPAAVPGGRNISIQDASGNLAVLTGGIQVMLKAPDIWTISPSEVPTSGGTTVNAEASNLQPGAMVVVGGTYVVPSSVTSTSLAFTAPAMAAGTYDVVVINPDGQESRLPGGLSYSGPPPPPPPAQGTGGSSGGGSTSGSTPAPSSSRGGGGGGGCALSPVRSTSDALGSLLPFAAIAAMGLVGRLRLRRAR